MDGDGGNLDISNNTFYHYPFIFITFLILIITIITAKTAVITIMNFTIIARVTVLQPCFHYLEASPALMSLTGRSLHLAVNPGPLC